MSIDRETIGRVGKAFALPGTVTEVVPVTDGLINRSFRVEYASRKGTRRYLFQEINTRVFTDPDGLMENIGRVTAHLGRKNAAGSYTRRALHFYPAADGRLCAETDGICWRAADYIPSVTPDKLAGLEVVRRVGQAFGEFQRALSDLDGRLLHETIPSFHDTAGRLASLFAHAEADPLGRRKEAEAQLAEFARLKDKAGALSLAFARGEFPVRVTHNDTKANNVLFDPDTLLPAAVIDLDTVMPGFAPYDFADAVRFLANTAAEDEPDVSKVALSPGRFRALAEGFVPEVRDAWTAEETEALPLACLSITVETAARFLDDYLTGDTYFRTSYPGHNLVRAGSQLALARSMEAQEAFMTAVTGELAAGKGGR